MSKKKPETRASRFAAFTFPEWSAPLFLLGLSLLSYGLLLPRLGFYWDDFPMTWIRTAMGAEGLARYFSTNRPVYGLLQNLFFAVLGDSALAWQIFALLWRWLAAVMLWALLRRLWPRWRQPAIIAAALMVVYPAFDAQHVAVVFSAFFLVLTALLGSLCCSLAALDSAGPRRLGLTAAGLALALLNLIPLEYFFLLELLRPLVVWLALGERGVRGRARLIQTARAWLPYLALFLGAVIWRAFFFPYQTQNYTPRILSELRAAPLNALVTLLGTLLTDILTVSLGAWSAALRSPEPTLLGARTRLLYGGLVLAVALGAAAYLLKLNPAPAALKGKKSPPAGEDRPGWALPALLLGLAGLLLAGWPFWLTGLPVRMEFPNSRFTLPFILGASLAVTGLIGLLPGKIAPKLALAAVLVGFGVGAQFQYGSALRRDWNTQKTLFWQMSWRMPGLQPGTTLLINDLPVQYYSDNSLTAPLNWLYAPENHSAEMSYMLYYPSIRTGSGLPALRAGLSIHQNYLAGSFEGSTSQVVTVIFSPPGCLRVLDARVETQNAMLSPLMRESAALSNPAEILTAPQHPARPPAALFDPEPAHGWCYYYEKADLARQAGDWAQVTALGGQAFDLDDYPNDPAERMPFIEGYAHTGDWQRALQLSDDSAQVSPLVRPALCALWQRIAADTPASDAQRAAVQQASGSLGCAK